MPQSHQDCILEVALPGHCGSGGDNPGLRAAHGRQSISLQHSAADPCSPAARPLPSPIHSTCQYLPSSQWCLQGSIN